MPRKAKEPEAPPTAEQLVEAAKKSLENKIRARSLVKLTEGARAITAELRRLAEPFLGKETPDGFEDLVKAMDGHEELEDFVTPEIKALLEEFGRLANDAAGSEEGAQRSRGRREKNARHTRKGAGAAAGAEGGDFENGLNPIAAQILSKAREKGRLVNNQELLSALGLRNRSSTFHHFRELIDMNLLRMEGGGRGAYYVPVEQ